VKGNAIMDALNLEDEKLASEILDLVPKFYYFISSLEPLRIPNQKNGPKEPKEIRIGERQYATLWLLDTLIKEKVNTNSCLQSDFEHVIHWWCPSMDQGGFSRLISSLEKADLVESKTYSSDDRFKEISLTKTGREMVNQVKNEKLKSLRHLIKLVGNRQDVMDALRELAELTWPIMKEGRCIE
jgi:DNA-binding PadR family transcriptional regulator